MNITDKIMKEAFEPTGDRTFRMDGNQIIPTGNTRSTFSKPFAGRGQDINYSDYVSFKKDQRPSAATVKFIGLVPDESGKLKFPAKPSFDQQNLLRANGGFILKVGDEKFATRNPMN